MAITTVSGFNDTDTLEFGDLPYKADASTKFNKATDILTVTSGDKSVKLRLTDTSVTQFKAEDDAEGDTEVVALCFASGTSILTSCGEISVEHLALGDLCVTASGRQRPVRWVGHRHLIFGAAHAAAKPVRIAAHAFGLSLPARDLLLSPGHPVLVGADEHGAGGCLVPIMCLINGTTIERVHVDRVTYWHVELDEHDILFAEGLPAESFLESGNRPWFASDEPRCDAPLMDPDFIAPGMRARCRPVAIDGPVVQAERSRLDAILVARLSAACAWPSENGVTNVF